MYDLEQHEVLVAHQQRLDAWLAAYLGQWRARLTPLLRGADGELFAFAGI